eukprot:1156788-Pelagomonas_calceolata.AAC.10
MHHGRELVSIDSTNLKKRKATWAEKTLPTSIKERETHWPKDPLPKDERGINMGRVGFWQHAAPGHQC